MESKLIARLCIVFVDNLTLMMRAALVVGAIFLVQDLRLATEKFRQPLVEVEPVMAVHEIAAEPAVEGHSSVYLRPPADDDTGYVRRDVQMLLARLDDHIDRAVSE